MFGGRISGVINNVKEQKFRHELKYYINHADYLTIRQRMSTIADTDEHADENGSYKIRSLYFDTPGDKALYEKLYGINNREKFRIRLYNDDDSFVRLEKKTKVNALTCKISAPVTRDQCEKLLVGDTDWMKNAGHALLTELYAKMRYEQLRPKTLVDYTREPFTYGPGNVRVTLDSNITTGIRTTDLFDPKMPTVSTYGVSVIILEVKYDNYLPDIIRNMIQVENRKATAFSKYAVARMFG
ncbi:hypothetical protein McpCs1_00410 [Methanocorpusculaceae archaeon Cs1]|uniref:VTC domain-containing protein n=1 Tax=Methanorbis rubei TaxID=3028300 RepID=A0AAE4SB72_9EURY|nr:hypothetical protein [Methanocorpusculaceae archaeon Cs1]